MKYFGDGFEVQTVGMHSIEYRDASRSFILGGERILRQSVPSDTTLMLAANPVTGWRVSDGHPVDESTKARVVEAVNEAVASWGEVVCWT
jgi:hypothetical protein